MSALPTLLLEVVLPVFAVVGVGAWVGGRFALPLPPIHRLAMYAAVPALAFRTLAGVEMAPLQALHLLTGYALLMLLLAGAAAFIARGWPLAARRALMGTSMLGNAANLNLPIALFAFGEAGLERALVIYVATSLVMFGVGPTLLGSARGWRDGVETALRFPVLQGAVVGVVVNVTNVPLPIGVERGVSLLADAAVPLVLLSLGLHLAQSRRWRPSGASGVGALLKLGLGPLLAYLIGRAIGLEGLDVAVLVLIGAMPTAINTAILASEFGGEVDQVAQTVIVGTFGSLLTLPLVLWVLQRFVAS
jgi:malate permease and related proteins